MGGPSFISVNRRGSKSSILQSRSIREGRAELRAASDCSDWPKTGTSTPHDQTGGSIAQILVTRRGPLSRSWRKGGVHCLDLGRRLRRPRLTTRQGGSIVQILVTRYGLMSRSWRLPGWTIWAVISYPRSPLLLSYVLIYLSMAT